MIKSPPPNSAGITGGHWFNAEDTTYATSSIPHDRPKDHSHLQRPPSKHIRAWSQSDRPARKGRKSSSRDSKELHWADDASRTSLVEDLLSSLNTLPETLGPETFPRPHQDDDYSDPTLLANSQRHQQPHHQAHQHDHTAPFAMDSGRDRIREASPGADFDLNPQDRQNRRRSRSYNFSSGTGSVLDRARPIPAEYHVFETSAAPRHGLRKSISYPAPPDEDDTFSAYVRQGHHDVRAEALGTQRAHRNKASDMLGGDAPSKSFYDTNLRTQERPFPSGLRNTGDASLPQPMTRPAGASGGAVQKEKPGFFRRVFGSSKNAGTASEPPQLPLLQVPDGVPHHYEPTESSATTPAAVDPPAAPSRPPPPEPETPTQEPQRVNKKPSSFFRRRRKTGTDKDARPRDASPEKSSRPSTSSLRKVMKPYLSDGQDPQSPIDPNDRYFDSLEQQPRAKQSETQDFYEFLQSTGPPSTWKTQNSQTVTKGSDSARRTHNDRRRPSLSARLVPRSESQPSVRDLADAGDSRATSISAVSKADQTSPQQVKSSLSQSRKDIATTRDDDDWVLSTPTRPAPTRQDSDRSNRIWLQGNEPQDVRRDDPELPKVLVNRTSGSGRQTHTSDQSLNDADYLSAKSVPAVQVDNEEDDPVSPLPISEARGVSPAPSMTVAQEQARRIFVAHDDPATQAEGIMALGREGEAADGLRAAFMEFFDFTGLNILLALRDLCSTLTVKGETQQVDRIVSAFSLRWCQCNSNHGFKSEDIVHTICYSLLLLNTDLHAANLSEKMTRNQFVKNTVPTLRRMAEVSDPDATLRAQRSMARGAIPFQDSGRSSPADPSADLRPCRDDSPGAGRFKSMRPTSMLPPITSPTPYDSHATDASELLVNSSHEGSMKSWEAAVETVLKEFYLSIRQLRLPLHGVTEVQQLQDQPSTSNLSVKGMVKRTGSLVSKTTSESSRGRMFDTRSLGGSRWSSKNRSRPKLYPSSNFGSSRTASHTSLDDRELWSPSGSSTWSKSLGQTTMSTDSLASRFTQKEQGYQQSIGFANALSQAMVREHPAEDPGDLEPPLLEDESLELAGAPWAKEGMVQYKQQLETTNKKVKKGPWTECFAVVSRGSLQLFSFSQKSGKKPSRVGGKVGAGNWQDKAEKVGQFALRQTLASPLPPPGYSSSRPHVFALSLPSGATHFFQAGTPEIVREFVDTVNYWSARLSKEPLVGGVSNVEYGWSDSLLAMAASDELRGKSATPQSSMSPPPGSFSGPSSRTPTTLSNPATSVHSPHSPSPSTSQSIYGHHHSSSRPSISGSLRSSFDTTRPAAFRSRMPADRVALSEWSPPTQSLMSSTLSEEQQLEALRTYIRNVEEDHARHQELRSSVAAAFSPKTVNASRAMSNWERKSSYLLHEIIKFTTYADALTNAVEAQKRVKAEEAERSAEAKQRAADAVNEQARLEAEEERAQKQAEEDLGIPAETLEALRSATGPRGRSGTESTG